MPSSGKEVRNIQYPARKKYFLKSPLNRRLAGKPERPWCWRVGAWRREGKAAFSEARTWVVRPARSLTSSVLPATRAPQEQRGAQAAHQRRPCGAPRSAPGVTPGPASWPWGHQGDPRSDPLFPKNLHPSAADAVQRLEVEM